MKHSISHHEFTKTDIAVVKKRYQENHSVYEEYISKLLWWNKKLNLVSRDVSRETLLRHVEHSLCITASAFFDKTPVIVDAGTGGGLPGIPLAVAYPNKKVTLNDVVSKKVTACKHMSSVLKLKNIQGKDGSIEEFKPEPDSLLISKHAFKINDLYKMIEGKPYAAMILLKGKDDVGQELKGIGEALRVKVYDLYTGLEHPFYKGKALVEISRKA